MEKSPFSYCLNTSTIRGQGLSLIEEIEITAKAGYQGIEPWIRQLDAYVAEGGTLRDLGQRIADLGLNVPNLIGFFEWVVDDEARRAAALEEARRNMEMAAQIGCPRLAAPPFGATDVQNINLMSIAARYRDLLELGEKMGVVPMVEFWGMSQTLSHLGEAVFVAMESGHRNACVLADIYHMYKAGSSHNGLRLIGPQTLGLVHVNDYPAEPPRETIADADRVYPGDGIAPLAQIFRDLYATGYRGTLSLELFNQTYWQQDALNVAKIGLEKMRTAVASAMGA